jgi:diguanylate cyclase (GGDEF)-like protein
MRRLLAAVNQGGWLPLVEAGLLCAGIEILATPSGEGTDIMKIAELLARKRGQTITARSDESVLLMASRLQDNRVGAMVVVDGDGNLEGIASERDLVRAITQYGVKFPKLSIGDIMTRKVITCTPDDNILETMKVMNAHHIRHIPVMDGRKPLTMVSIREFDYFYMQLQNQAHTDDLTGVANRRHFMEELNKELARYRRHGTPFAVAVLDVDHFKNVNDTFGHDAGDRVLCAIARCLVETLRAYDGVGRIGGEEFGILLPNTSLQAAEETCKRLLARLRSEEVSVEEGTIRVTASIGVSAGNPTTRGAESIIKAADKNLYAAKAGGRNRVVVDPYEPEQSEASAILEQFEHLPQFMARRA